MSLLTSSPVNAHWRLTEKLKRSPVSVLALLVQLSALLTTWLAAQLVTMSGHMMAIAALQQLPIMVLVMTQSVIACVYAHKLNMAHWWLRIHAAFPIALYITYLFELSSTAFLTGFIVSLMLYWTVFKTQVPFYPSMPIVWRTVDQCIAHHFRKHHQPINIIEIGSGLGDFSLYLDKRNHLYQVKGIEVAPLPWLISQVRQWLSKSQATFQLGNYEQLNFADYEVIFAYLSPAAMPALWEKASQEMQSGSLLVSLEFDIPNVKPTQVVHTNQNNPKLYIWEIH